MAEKKAAASAAVKCTDENCPRHGSLRTRGQVFDGTVKSSKMSKVVDVEWSFLRYMPKFERYEKRRTKVKAHNPPCMDVREGDSVRIVECRPLSRTVKFVVWEKLK
jgi:small subunit ribosomal protein S17